jgi:hypothetical protein
VPKHVFNNVQSKSRWWKKDFGSKSAKAPEKDVFGVTLLCFLEIIADLDTKSFFHHLDFDWTLLKTC